MTEDKARLADQEVDRKLAELPGWTRDGIFLRKDFIFANFAEINAFLPHLTGTIVKQNHHPDFAFVGVEKRVTVQVTTHSEGGLTQADIDLARGLENW